MKKSAQSPKRYSERIGPVMKKALLLLAAGASLMLSGSPRKQFRIIRSAAKEWRRIDQRALREAIRKLYCSQMVDFKEHADGTVSLVLARDGQEKVLRYNLDSLTIKRPARWDGWWRVVTFDVPETYKQGRNALAGTLKRLGFYPFQKSVFVYPHECRDEVDFVVELFKLRPYVRFLHAKETDVDLHLREIFHLSEK
ncbi:MAG: hypothetical protein HY978_01100 [Candidatus Liptonbacteria bacterium]|nr:hypothetical protein [Candidatus Liptonbacteria bacterium]